MNGTIMLSYKILCKTDVNNEISIQELLSNEKILKSIKAEYAKGLRNVDVLSYIKEGSIKIESQKKVYTFEVPSSTEWAFGQFTPVFRPTVFVEIEDYLENKIAAMECYESEARGFPHPRSPEALRALAHRWGSAAGLNAAEAFELVRWIRP